MRDLMRMNKKETKVYLNEIKKEMMFTQPILFSKKNNHQFEKFR